MKLGRTREEPLICALADPHHKNPDAQLNYEALFATGLDLLWILIHGGHVTIPVVILYCLAQLVFEMGPDFTTSILPVETYPIRHRDFGYEIAAATGKLGAAISQVFFQIVEFHKRIVKYRSHEGDGMVRLTVLCFIHTTLVKAMVKWVLVPEDET
ncbi:hypothetical protein VTL71DRAFT_11241 [Oculimacula yallundae]|uniref:Uncharacterized protein n=1 Tax=Oculimacula yallundae TaxID=86028 RepID=A0ABR4CVM5_9HELO